MMRCRVLASSKAALSYSLSLLKSWLLTARHRHVVIRSTLIAESPDWQKITAAYTHTHPFNGRFSWTTRISQYQKGKTNLDFTEARDSEWQWHQLGHMQVCTSLQTDNHTSTPPLKFFTGRMPFLPPNQQRQSTEGIPLWQNTVETFTGTILGVNFEWKWLNYACLVS